MAEKRTINIDIKNNADETAKDFDTLNKSIDNTTKSTKNLNSTFEEVYGELQPLTTRMGEAEDRLYELALAGDTASKEYQELLTKVGEYRKVQIQTDLAVDAAATTLGQKLGGALTGATAGFSLAQGSMALLGGESEALEKTLLKVQAAIAIQQGVQGIRESIPAFKQLGSVAKNAFKGMTKGAKLFAATGLGLVITGIATAIAMFDDIDESEEDLEEQRKQREEEEKARHQAYLARQQAKIDSIQRESEAEIAALDRERRLALAQGKSVAEFEKAILEETLNGIQTTGEAYVKENNEIRESVKELNDERKIYVENLPYETEAEAKASRKYIANIDKELKAFKNRNKQIVKLVKVESEKREEALTELAIYDAEILKDRNDNYKEWAKERLSIARLIEDIQNSLLTDGIEKELEINRDKFRRLREDAEKNTKLTTEERATLIDLRNQEEAQAEAKIIADNQKRRSDAFEAEKSERVELLNFVDELNTAEVESEKAKNLAILESSKDAAAKQKEIDEKAKADAKEIQDFKFDIASQGLQTISNLTELFAGKSEKAAKKAFQVQKAVSIAQATIDTYKSANAIFASTSANPITILNPAAPFIAAGVAVAAGLVNVATIASQQFQGGGSTGGGGQESAPDLGGGATPQFNVVGDSGINQIAQLQQQPVQAFVVSGEVTTSQALDRNRVQNATL